MKFVFFSLLLVTLIALVRSAPADDIERPELLSELSAADIHVLTLEEMAALGYSDVPLQRSCNNFLCVNHCRTLVYRNGICLNGRCVCYN